MGGLLIDTDSACIGPNDKAIPGLYAAGEAIETGDLAMKMVLVGGLVAIFWIFPYIGNNHPNWLSYFSEGWPKTTNQGDFP